MCRSHLVSCAEKSCKVRTYDWWHNRWLKSLGRIIACCLMNGPQKGKLMMYWDCFKSLSASEFFLPALNTRVRYLYCDLKSQKDHFQVSEQARRPWQRGSSFTLHTLPSSEYPTLSWSFRSVERQCQRQGHRWAGWTEMFYSPSRPRGRPSCLCAHHKDAAAPLPARGGSGLRS